MNPKLQGVELQPGMVLNMCQRTAFGWLVRRALGRAYARIGGHDPYRNCPSHSAIVVRVNNKIWIGESKFPVATLTPVDQYVLNLESGTTYNLRILRVTDATPHQEEEAATWWLEHILNSPYDIWALVRILVKIGIADIRWANWCTEGIMRAWRDGAGLDPYRNDNPTPLTEFKRWLEGEFTCLNAVSGKQ